MGTDQLLDLFQISEKQQAADAHEDAESSDNRKLSMKEAVDQLSELHDDSQYETEFNLDSFVASMRAATHG